MDFIVCKKRKMKVGLIIHIKSCDTDRQLQSCWQTWNSCRFLIIYTFIYVYPQPSNIRRMESLKLNVSRIVLHLSLPNPQRPGVKSRMKDGFGTAPTGMLKLHLHDFITYPGELILVVLLYMLICIGTHVYHMHIYYTNIHRDYFALWYIHSCDTHYCEGMCSI